MIDAFPYPPYDIQKQLMVNVYEALRQRRIGLFESPTGDYQPGATYRHVAPCQLLLQSVVRFQAPARP